MRKLILVKHAKPEVQPDVPSQQWGLSEAGRSQCQALASRLAEHSPDLVVASQEPKAAETGKIVAEALGKPFSTVPGLQEHDRSNVPMMHSSEFISHIALFFQKWDQLVLGRETAKQALTRFSAAVETAMNSNAGNIAVFTHGTVLALYVADRAKLDPFACWRRMGLPSFLVLDWPAMSVLHMEERI